MRRPMNRIADQWNRLVGIRYRTLVELTKAWQAYSGRPPSRVRAWANTARLVAAPRKTILCYPMRPAPYAVLYKLCAVAGYWITTDPGEPCDAVFRWHDVTRSDLGSLPHDEAAVNRRCTDIRKRRVSRVFADVFGYDLSVDPTTYVGRAFMKSDENATHDGVVIDCPIPADEVSPGSVYQRAVDNRRDDADGFYEYRVPVLGSAIPVVYVKYRPPDTDYKAFDAVDIVSPEAVLSETERAQVLAFAGALGMEYGEMDVLRDRGDGRIYVVDANNTPSGPSRGFRPEQSVEALRALRPAFEALLAGSARKLAAAGHPGSRDRRRRSTSA